MMGKTINKSKRPQYEEYCTVQAKDGLDARACDVIARKMKEKVDGGKIFVHHIDSGQKADIDSGREADITQILELANLDAVYLTKLVVYTHDPGLQEEIDEAAEIIMKESFYGPLT